MEIKDCGEGDCRNGVLIQQLNQQRLDAEAVMVKQVGQIAQLKSDRAGDQQRMFHYERVIAKQEERIKKLEDALVPFAEFGANVGEGQLRPSRISPEHVITAGSRLAKRQLTMGDCYNAADVLVVPKDEGVP